METTKLRRFAQYARRNLIEQVSAKLKLVLSQDSSARRESVEAVRKLEEAINLHDKDQVIERVAYIWFNRFCALRFMDVNRYNRVGIVSPADPGQFQPEILAEAKMGHIDEEMVNDKIRQKIFALLDGKAPSHDPQGEAYRLLIVGACNYWNKAMPFLFERIDDYTELLMPDDLLSGNSILAYTREAMTPDVCQDVEVIGWLYQFYISEKKDEVFEGLKKNKKITPENIPAATQLFTPHWIVRYLVENSLGRLWLLNRPQSRIFLNMKERGEDCYYIEPVQPETDFLKIDSPEEIKICDPACGSGHMLTYAFDLLYAIYEEEGYEPAEIPEKILTHNLYGIEIDERAGELAAFALTMKARAKQRRLFNKGIKPNICVLENIHFDEDELKEYMHFVGRDLLTLGLDNTLRQFEEADNFGSLIRPDVTDVDGMLRILESKDFSADWLYNKAHLKVLQALRQANYLSPKYHVVIANPPYASAKGLNARLADWLKRNYPDSKSDLYAAFIERGYEYIQLDGVCAMVTMESWMFLSSFERFRTKLLKYSTINSMVHMPYLGKGRTSMGINFGTTAFVSRKMAHLNIKGNYCCVRYFECDEKGIPISFPPKNERLNLVATEDFSKIPGSPLAYWLSSSVLAAFQSGSLGEQFNTDGQNKTSNNEKYLRFVWEVNSSTVGKDRKWVLCAKGGDFRKWYGNLENVIDWSPSARNFYRNDHSARILSEKYWYEEGITWTDLTSASTAFRLLPNGTTFETKGPSLFPLNKRDIPATIAYLNSKLTRDLLKALNPTMSTKINEVRALPKLPLNFNFVSQPTIDAIDSAKLDWDSSESSWGFTSPLLLNLDYLQPTIQATYQKLRAHWREMTLKMQRLEEENNRIFINAYGLQDELTPEVPLNEITLTCNPHYRYGGDKPEYELETLLLADTMRELVSYAVGCMFGRYALDKPGLILANQGDTVEDYLKQVPEPSFPADDDNVIPMLDGDWFTDDIAERFRKFLRVAFGEEHYEENVKFVEQALNVKGKREYTIRDYFLGEFYTDHVKRYKKRPIYWLFSSPKGSFNALIYMHRYRPGTVSVVLNDYLREFRTKLTAHKNHLEAVSISASAAQSEKAKALKEIEKINKIIAELEEYEREVLYPLATQQIEIDLDNGVKYNYPLFGAALKKIPGLDAKEDD
jgi:type II restriction/modification system DNA methylase subunit YeeA